MARIQHDLLLKYAETYIYLHGKSTCNRDIHAAHFAWYERTAHLRQRHSLKMELRIDVWDFQYHTGSITCRSEKYAILHMAEWKFNVVVFK